MRSPIAALATLLALPPAAQQAPPAGSDPVFESGANKVLLDLVVRDRRGRAIRDLDPSEVVIFENGVEQQIVAFRLVDREEGRIVERAAATEPPAPGSTQGATESEARLLFRRRMIP